MCIMCVRLSVFVFHACVCECARVCECTRYLLWVILYANTVIKQGMHNNTLLIFLHIHIVHATYGSTNVLINVVFLF